MMTVITRRNETENLEKQKQKKISLKYYNNVSTIKQIKCYWRAAAAAKKWGKLISIFNLITQEKTKCFCIKIYWKMSK